MPAFCSSCGSPRNPNSAFCGQCGNAVGNSPNAAGPSVASPLTPAVVTAQGGSSALKIVLVLVCCLVVGGAAVVGGVVYLAHRVKQAVVEKAAENGVDLSSIGHTHATSEASAEHPLPKVCEILSNADVSGLIGEPIARSEPESGACNYYGPPGLIDKLEKEQGNAGFEHLKAQNGALKGLNKDGSLENVVKEFGKQTGLAEAPRGEQPLLMIQVGPDGKTHMTAMAANKAIFSYAELGTDIAGLGDKAIRLAPMGLSVLKGDNFVSVIPGPFPDSDAKTINVARAVLRKL